MGHYFLDTQYVRRDWDKNNFKGVGNGNDNLARIQQHVRNAQYTPADVTQIPFLKTFSIRNNIFYTCICGLPIRSGHRATVFSNVVHT